MTKTENEPISVQKLKLENALLWKFVAEISDAGDTFDGKRAIALLKRFKKDRYKLRKSRMRLPSVSINNLGV